MNTEFVIPGLVFLSVIAVGAALIAARARRGQTVAQRLQTFSPELDDLRQNDSRPWLINLLADLGSILAPGGASLQLRERLAMAGYFNRSAAPMFIAVKMLLLLVGLGAMAFAMAPANMGMGHKMLLMFSVGALLSFVPNIILNSRLRHRRGEVRNFLPDAVDLLEICVSSGMGLDMAWNAVADEIRRVSPILADEMLLTNLEMHLGGSRADAMRHMARRTGSDDVNSLVALLVQTERFGTSLSDCLRTFAVTMREIRAERAEEAAEKMAVKLLFPMILFIFPCMMVVTAGPATLTLIKLFSE